MSIVITGGSGFLGSTLLRTLVAAGRSVVTIDRRPLPETAADSPRVDALVADLTGGADQVTDALLHADAVLHLAGCPGVRDSAADVAARRRRDNVEATGMVLRATPADTSVIVVSSSSVYGGAAVGPASLGGRRHVRASRERDRLCARGGYAASKVAAEDLCRARAEAGGHVLVVRPFTILGEGQRPDMAVSRWAAEAMSSGVVTLLGSPERTRDVTDVRDVGAVLVRLLDAGSTGIVNLGTGRGRTLAEIASAVCAAVGVEPCFRLAPAGPAEAAHTRADTDRLRRWVGFVPHTDLDAVVTRAVRQPDRPALGGPASDKRIGVRAAPGRRGDVTILPTALSRNPLPDLARGRVDGASPAVDRRALIVACLVAGLLATATAASGITIRAATVGAAAVDEPQYLLSAISLWEDHDLDISDERAQGRAKEFHDGALPVQTAVLDRGRRVSPHDPLLPLLLAPAVGLGGWVGAKLALSVLAGLLTAATAWLAGTRWAVPAPLAGTVAAIAGMTAPLAVYGHQVYPEVPAALAVVIAVGAILPPLPLRSGNGRGSPAVRAVVLVAAISALPWLAVKYTPVALALASLGLLRLRSTSRQLAVATGAALAGSGVVWLAAHRYLYGGWTAYATGDQFQASGEFGAVGFTPNPLGRSTRLIGLLADRDYGLLAWQPGWLLMLPALGLLLALRVRGRDLLLIPGLVGWLTASLVALTMHGYWWPGRQVVVVLPLAVIMVALALTYLGGRRPTGRVVLVLAGVLGALGVVVHAWVLLAGHAGTLTWIGAAGLDRPAGLGLFRAVLPDYRRLSPADWWLHAGWIGVALTLVAAGALLGRRLRPREVAPGPGHEGDHR